MEKSKCTIYSLSTKASYVTWYCTLNHEVLDDAMKGGTFVPLRHSILSIFSCAELPEVLSSPRNNVCEEFHFHAPHLNSSDRYVKKDYRICLLGFLIAWHNSTQLQDPEQEKKEIRFKAHLAIAHVIQEAVKGLFSIFHFSAAAHRRKLRRVTPWLLISRRTRKLSLLLIETSWMRKLTQIGEYTVSAGHWPIVWPASDGVRTILLQRYKCFHTQWLVANGL